MPDRHALGMKVRREVLGDAHVDRAEAQKTDLDGAFQDLITEAAWGTVWASDAISRRERSMLTLALLVGGAYALYRTNSGIRDQIDGLLGRVDPGIKGNLSRAADAVKDAASDVMDGKSPVDAAKRAGGELQRAGEKALDGAKDTAADVKQDAQAKAKDLKDDAQNAAKGN